MPHLFSCLLKFAPFAGRRSAHARWWLGARIALLSMVAVDASALVEAYPLAAQLREARVLAGVSPERAFAVLERLRQEAVRIQSLAARLEADEIECRLLTDIDPEKGLKIGQAGLAAVGDRTLSGAAQLNQLRLQICIDSVRAEDDQHAEGVASFDAIVAMTAQQPDMASARALALLERGVYHSRRGDLSKGQQDLLTACDLLRRVGQPRDLDLCMGHLANHYKRMGSLDDALRYLQELTDAARARGAVFDQGIYAFLLAQVHVRRAEWAQALANFEEALSLAPFSADPVNVGFAEEGIGEVKLEQGRAEEAERHFRKALTLLEPSSERKQVLWVKVRLAAARTAQGNAAAAVRSLDEIRPAVDAMSDALLLSHWLETAAKARAGAEDWRGAYEALAAFREVDARIQTQRLSDQSARLRVQFNQEKDAQDMAALRELNDRGQELRHTQAIALGLFVLLLVLTLAYTVHKFRQAKRLETLALSDELTGLPNRRAVLARADALIESARREGHPFSLLLVDVDHFKRINDQWGHAAGDSVLVEVARRQRSVLREQDLVVRWGGEEFLILVRSENTEDARLLAQRLLDQIGGLPVNHGPLAIPISASIGFASFPMAPSGLTLEWERAVDMADTVMYMSKAHGRNKAYGVAAIKAGTREELLALAGRMESAWHQGQVDLISLLGPQMEDRA